VRNRIDERVSVLIGESSVYMPALPTGAVFLTAMAGQFVAVFSVVGKNFAVVDYWLLKQFTFFGMRKVTDSPTTSQLCLLFAFYLVAYLVPLVPPTIAAWVTMLGISTTVPLNVAQAVQFTPLEGGRGGGAYLVTMVQPYAQIDVKYSTVTAVTAVLALVVSMLAAWTAAQVWNAAKKGLDFVHFVSHN
jgi:hypothetical protein